jgi:hypothetical protein
VWRNDTHFSLSEEKKPVSESKVAATRFYPTAHFWGLATIWRAQLLKSGDDHIPI